MAKAATEKKPKEPKVKQARLDGFANKKDLQVEEALEAWDAIVQERMGLTKKEVEAHDNCIRVMERNGREEYRIGNTVFRVNQGKHKVKRIRVTEEDEVEEQVAKDEKKEEQDRKKAAGGDKD